MCEGRRLSRFTRARPYFHLVSRPSVACHCVCTTDYASLCTKHSLVKFASCEGPLSESGGRSEKAREVAGCRPKDLHQLSITAKVIFVKHLQQAQRSLAFTHTLRRQVPKRFHLSADNVENRLPSRRQRRWGPAMHSITRVPGVSSGTVLGSLPAMAMFK
jgi:hypothetical protein